MVEKDNGEKKYVIGRIISIKYISPYGNFYDDPKLTTNIAFELDINDKFIGKSGNLFQLQSVSNLVNLKNGEIENEFNEWKIAYDYMQINKAIMKNNLATLVNLAKKFDKTKIKKMYILISLK